MYSYQNGQALTLHALNNKNNPRAVNILTCKHVFIKVMECYEP